MKPLSLILIGDIYIIERFTGSHFINTNSRNMMNKDLLLVIDVYWRSMMLWGYVLLWVWYWKALCKPLLKAHFKRAGQPWPL